MLRNVTNPAAKEYFLSRFNPLAAKTRSEWIESSLNKIGSFTTDPYIRAVLENPHSTINFREIIDRPGSVLLIRLPKGILKENAFLLGALLNSKIQEAALSRTDIPLQKRERFHLYVDEVQNFGGTSLNFQEVLSESGKYGLSMTCAHQNTEQINEDFLASLLANCDCQISFRISRQDADIIAKEIFKIDVCDLELERSEGIVKHTLEEKWEEAKNTLTQQKKREMCAVIKGTRSAQLKTITVPNYAVSDRELEALAEMLTNLYRPDEACTTEDETLPQEQEHAVIPNYKNPTEF